MSADSNSDVPSLAALLNDIVRLIVPNEPKTAGELCFFNIRMDGERGRIVLKIAPTEEQARGWFAVDGHLYHPPTQRTSASFRRTEDGRITDYVSYPRTNPLPEPIVSEVSLPALGDENRVWRDHGVIKIRVGRFGADIVMPHVEEAERIARHVADVLKTG